MNPDFTCPDCQTVLTLYFIPNIQDGTTLTCQCRRKFSTQEILDNLRFK